MGKKLVIFLFAFIQIIDAYSQTYTLLGDKTFGTASQDFLSTIIRGSDGNLLLVGATSANKNQDKTDPRCDSTINFGSLDLWLLKIDTAFNILWDKSIGGSMTEVTPHIFQRSNGDIVLSCQSSSDSTCEKSENNHRFPQQDSDYWICILDSDGSKINDKTWGGTGQEDPPFILQFNSGNYIIAGTSNSPISGDKTDTTFGTSRDYWIIKTDSSGNKLWDNVIGGAGFEQGSQPANSSLDFRFMILPTENDAFILAGTTDSPVSIDISDSSRGDLDIWITKIDSAGNKVWDKRYGGSANDICEHIVRTKDKGYILSGSLDSPQGGDVSEAPKGGKDCWVIKLDSLGNKLWDRRFGGSMGTIGTWIEEAPGGGYWISGLTNSDSTLDISEPKYSLIGYDLWILKIDDLGNKLWDKRFGGHGQNNGTAFIIMPDSSILLYGTSETGISPVKTDSGKGLNDYWVVHFKYTDNYVGIEEQNNFSNNVVVYPNPTKDIVTINSPSEKIKEIEIFNLVGETIYQNKAITDNSAQLNLINYPSGIYFLKVKGDKHTVTKKVIKN